jgi:hypothetical protein
MGERGELGARSWGATSTAATQRLCTTNVFIAVHLCPEARTTTCTDSCRPRPRQRLHACKPLWWNGPIKDDCSLPLQISRRTRLPCTSLLRSEALLMLESSNRRCAPCAPWCRGSGWRRWRPRGAAVLWLPPLCLGSFGCLRGILPTLRLQSTRYSYFVECHGLQRTGYACCSQHSFCTWAHVCARMCVIPLFGLSGGIGATIFVRCPVCLAS